MTEELERLEQSITLTLQGMLLMLFSCCSISSLAPFLGRQSFSGTDSSLPEIDHNFSKAHRIVTTSILPLVEQYGEHSKNVWEASKVRILPRLPKTSLNGGQWLAWLRNEYHSLVLETILRGIRKRVTVRL